MVACRDLPDEKQMTSMDGMLNSFHTIVQLFIKSRSVRSATSFSNLRRTVSGMFGAASFFCSLRDASLSLSTSLGRDK